VEREAADGEAKRDEVEDGSVGDGAGKAGKHDEAKDDEGREARACNPHPKQKQRRCQTLAASFDDSQVVETKVLFGAVTVRRHRLEPRGGAQA
jgi:hypothetical protein